MNKRLALILAALLFLPTSTSFAERRPSPPSDDPLAAPARDGEHRGVTWRYRFQRPAEGDEIITPRVVRDVCQSWVEEYACVKTCNQAAAGQNLMLVDEGCYREYEWWPPPSPYEVRCECHYRSLRPSDFASGFSGCQGYFNCK